MPFFVEGKRLEDEIATLLPSCHKCRGKGAFNFNDRVEVFCVMLDVTVTLLATT